MTTTATPGRDELTLVAEIQEFDSFLNQSPTYEDQTKVRDYRHAAYAKWSMLSRKIIALLAAKPADEGVLRRCADIALAIDSGRGNEKEIAKAILAFSTTGEPKR